MQLGPADVLVNVGLVFRPALTVAEVAASVRVEAAVCEAHPAGVACGLRRRRRRTAPPLREGGAVPCDVAARLLHHAPLDADNHVPLNAFGPSRSSSGSPPSCLGWPLWPQRSRGGGGVFSPGASGEWAGLAGSFAIFVTEWRRQRDAEREAEGSSETGAR